MKLTLIDTVFFILISAGGVWGAKAGAVRVVGPFALILAVITLIQAFPDISARCGTAPRIHVLLMFLLVAFVVVFLSGLLIRALQAVAELGLGANVLAGLLLGLITGTVVAGAIVWWVQAQGGPEVKALVGGSVLAPALLEFFHTIVSFSERLLPHIETKSKESWCKPGLW